MPCGGFTMVQNALAERPLGLVYGMYAAADSDTYGNIYIADAKVPGSAQCNRPAQWGLLGGFARQAQWPSKSTKVSKGLPSALSFSEPPSSGKSTITAHSVTTAPKRSNSLTPAIIVPPVAIKSSISSTR